MNYKDYERIINNLKDYKVGFDFIALEVALEVYYKTLEVNLADKEKELIFTSAYEIYLKTENLTISEIVDGLTKAKDKLNTNMTKQQLIALVLVNI